VADVLEGVNSSTLQFAVNAIRTRAPLDLTVASNRSKINTDNDQHERGGRAIRNPDGTALTFAQIAAATNLTVAQITALAGRV
jgi:hypothetical protein